MEQLWQCRSCEFSVRKHSLHRQSCRVQTVVNKLGFQVKLFMGNILWVLVFTVVCAQTVDGVSLVKGSWTSRGLHTPAIWLLHLSVRCPP